jgi:hypothetical protein
MSVPEVRVRRKEIPMDDWGGWTAVGAVVGRYIVYPIGGRVVCGNSLLQVRAGRGQLDAVAALAHFGEQSRGGHGPIATQDSAADDLANI